MDGLPGALVQEQLKKTAYILNYIAYTCITFLKISLLPMVYTRLTSTNSAMGPSDAKILIVF